MWCRTILTAVAISYVICMLLWSGLQKEDLDPGTLEKLRRYNVNIDDMNNEQRRQECLLDQITTEVQRETLKPSATNDRTVKDHLNVGIYPKIGMLLAANYEDKTVVHFNSDDTKGNFEQVSVNAEIMPGLGNETNFEDNKAMIKIEYNIQNQPDVESVMNFWTKLTHRTTTVATLPTTLVAPITKLVHFETDKAKNGTDTAITENQNDGYVHSREMEYISRVLAEYLASQTTPTTTESVSTKKVYAKYVPTKYWEISNKAAIKEEMEGGKQRNEINKINATQDTSQSDKAIDNSMLDEGKNKEFKDSFDTQLMKMIQETSSSHTEPIAMESKPLGRSYSKGILNKLLRMKNDLFNNGFIIPETEFETKTINKSNDQREKSEPFNLFNIFQNKDVPNKNKSYNFMMNSGESINAPMKAETMITDEPEVTHIPADINKSKFHQNYNLKHRGSRFQALLPSIKYSNQNKKSETVESQGIGTQTHFNTTENYDLESFSVKKATVNQQPTVIKKYSKNLLFKLKNDTFNTDSIIGKIAQNSKETVKKALIFQALKESNYDHIRENEQSTVQGMKSNQNVDSMNVSDLQAIPADIIKEIAEKVKLMVLKDIGENITTTTVETASSTSAINTSEPPSTSLQKEFAQSNQVMQKLMEIFKELKAMKDTAKLISQVPQNDSNVSNLTTILPQQSKQQAPASFNPYLMQSPTNFKPIQASSYASKVPAPISFGIYPQNKATQYMLPLNAQPRNNNHLGAITIQTNSDEIAPLPIQISKRSKVMNQHIVLTTKRTVDKIKEERERESMKHVANKFRIPNEDISHRGKLDVQSDLPKNVQFAEKHEVRDRYSYRGGYLDREKPLYHEYHEKVRNFEHPVRSRFPELHYPGRLAHLEHSGRPRDLSAFEDSGPPRGYNRPAFNEAGSHKNGIRHHPGSYSHSVRDRQPRYEATKFHEKLERIENWPRSAWKDYHSPSDSSNDEISARQQMPLVKLKKRTRYDDTHFMNFLKSQQKVTDMLEKILANNLKNSSPHSVETP